MKWSLQSQIIKENSKINLKVKDLILKKYLIVLISLIFSINTYGQSIDRLELNSSLSNIKATPVEHNGVNGVWFSNEDAEIILDVLEKKLPLAIDTIDKQDKQIQSLKIAVDSYKEVSKSYSDIADLNLKMFNVAMENVPKIIPSEPAWYESQKAMFMYGILVGGAVMLGSTYLAVQVLQQK